MKVRVVVTDGSGNTFEGETTLVTASGARPRRQTRGGKPPRPERTRPDLSLPVRAFVKRHAKGLSGGQKFTALLARMSGGKPATAVSVKDIEKEWNRVSGLMGGKFYTMYGVRAKEEGWVDTQKTGQYTLRPGWEDALGS